MNVFVSSLSDVYEEREILDGVVRDINNTWMDALGIMLKTKKWETNVPSKITNQDPTDIIIEEIGEYDIHIGIMWSRFGSPTNEYESGTEQEFRTALNYYKEYKKPLIKFYFSKREFRLETQEEIDQFRQVKNFENEIKNMGIIKYYQSIEEFRYMLFMELSICIKEEFIKSKGD